MKKDEYKYKDESIQDVNRYDCDYDNYEECMIKDPLGSWVEYNDYISLKDETQELKNIILTQANRITQLRKFIDKSRKLLKTATSLIFTSNA